MASRGSHRIQTVAVPVAFQSSAPRPPSRQTGRPTPLPAPVPGRAPQSNRERDEGSAFRPRPLGFTGSSAMNSAQENRVCCGSDSSWWPLPLVSTVSGSISTSFQSSSTRYPFEHWAKTRRLGMAIDRNRKYREMAVRVAQAEAPRGRSQAQSRRGRGPSTPRGPGRSPWHHRSGSGRDLVLHLRNLALAREHVHNIVPGCPLPRWR